MPRKIMSKKPIVIWILALCWLVIGLLSVAITVHDFPSLQNGRLFIFTILSILFISISYGLIRLDNPFRKLTIYLCILLLFSKIIDSIFYPINNFITRASVLIFYAFNVVYLQNKKISKLFTTQITSDLNYNMISSWGNLNKIIAGKRLGDYLTIIYPPLVVILIIRLFFSAVNLVMVLSIVFKGPIVMGVASPLSMGFTTGQLLIEIILVSSIGYTICKKNGTIKQCVIAGIFFSLAGSILFIISLMFDIITTVLLGFSGEIKQPIPYVLFLVLIGLIITFAMMIINVIVAVIGGAIGGKIFSSSE
jgi:hypothetical protein